MFNGKIIHIPKMNGLLKRTLLVMNRLLKIWNKIFLKTFQKQKIKSIIVIVVEDTKHKEL